SLKRGSEEVRQRRQLRPGPAWTAYRRDGPQTHSYVQETPLLEYPQVLRKARAASHSEVSCQPTSPRSERRGSSLPPDRASRKWRLHRFRDAVPSIRDAFHRAIVRRG